MEDTTREQQTLCIKNREILELDAVLNVEGFTDDSLTLATKAGRVSVEGRDLKIEDLSKENGKILVTGHIDGIFYIEGGEEKHGFFGKIFR